MNPVLDIYDEALTAASAALNVRWDGGERLRLPVARWLGPATAAERDLLERAEGPVLDVGCGPGRHVDALTRLGVEALGVDVSRAAVRLARRRGAEALQRSVFGPVPREGEWRTALLLDGNVGIGGDPAALLRRVGALLAPGGRALVELDPPGEPTVRGVVRLERRARCSATFPWARVGVDDAEALAAASGFTADEVWSAEGRWFADLRTPQPTVA